MKFSYSLIKKLVPALKNKKDLINKLNLHFFETEDVAGDVLDISIPPNRFSDAASHWGIAAEISAILGVNFRNQKSKIKNQKSSSPKSSFKVLVQDKNLCPRYTAQYFENIKIGPSPKWMQKILIDCGLRSINNVVDIMNYVMLETGQPLHAFDYDKLTQTNADYTQTNAESPRQSASSSRKSAIIIRRAKKGEKITTLDDKTYELNENILVIADGDSPRESAVLAIAGIKGGKKAEVDKNTKRIIVESANFNGVNIYKSSKLLKLPTDASLRFSHNISPELTALGLNRAAELLKQITGAKIGPIIDVNSTKPRKRIIKFDLEKFNKFIGADLDIKTCRKYLERLGFKIGQQSIVKSQQSFLVEVPPLRSDIEIFEDLAEEVIRLYGYNRLKSIPPHIHLRLSGFEDQIVLKDKIKKVLMATGLSEVYNYSFISDEDAEKFIRLDPRSHPYESALIELENPISNQFKYLRPSLAPYLVKNINSNFRFFDEVRIFEIGHTFTRNYAEKDAELRRNIPRQSALSPRESALSLRESMFLGIALASKKDKQVFFELKGIIEELFKKVGLVNYLMPEFSLPYSFLIPGEVLKIESDGETIGYLGRINKELVSNYEGVLAEIDLDALLKLVEEEHEYLPLPKYPSVMRDVSILVEPTIRVGEIMQAIQSIDFKYVEDVDLIDEFDYAQNYAEKDAELRGKSPRESTMRRSLTFRIIFQAEDRTLTDEEVNKEMGEIAKMLKSKFRAIIR